MIYFISFNLLLLITNTVTAAVHTNEIRKIQLTVYHVPRYPLFIVIRIIHFDYLNYRVRIAREHMCRYLHLARIKFHVSLLRLKIVQSKSL